MVNQIMQILEYLSEGSTICGVGLKAGIYGGSGFVGAELVRLLAGHPEVGATSVSSRGYAGRGISEVYPHLGVGGEYVEPDEIDASGLDAAFVAYGHGESAGAVKELLDGYARYDFPVRTILIDSPWSDRYNDFKVDEKRYPDPEKFFRGLQDSGYRVVLG